MLGVDEYRAAQSVKGVAGGTSALPLNVTRLRVGRLYQAGRAHDEATAHLLSEQRLPGFGRGNQRHLRVRTPREGHSGRGVFCAAAQLANLWPAADRHRSI